MLKTSIKTALIIFLIGVATLATYRSLSIAQIPEAENIFPVAVSKDEVPVPRRPGTKSIRIVGPPLKILKFQVDFKRNPLPLDWRFLERIDKRADVMIDGEIDENGNFTIERMLDRGHPKAGQYIQKIMTSWKFVQYKSGKIKYYFNVPTKAERMKVQIDITDLSRNLKFVGRTDFLKDGLLYYIEGLKARNVTVIHSR
jgi:hypothetical protein